MDFPLRGFVTRNGCSNPLTANWSTSKTGKKHPYRMCFTKGCESYRKSIRRDVLEGEFAEVVQALQPSQRLYDIALAMFKDAWQQRLAQAEGMLRTLRKEIAKTDKKIEGLLARIVEASHPRVVSAYEAKLVSGPLPNAPSVGARVLRLFGHRRAGCADGIHQ